MEFRMQNRDYVPDGAGGFLRAEGTEAILEQALYLLSARRGSFSLLPEVGSRLYLLGREKPSAREFMGKIYAQEALDALGLIVTGVTILNTDPIQVTVTARGTEEEISLEVYAQ